MSAAQGARPRFGRKAEEDQTRVPGGLSGTFFGSAIPDDVIQFVPLLHTEAASTDVVRTCIANVIEHIRAGTRISVSANTYVEQSEVAGYLHSGLFTILRSAISSKVNTTRIVADLKRMNVPAQVADDIGHAFLESRAQLEASALRHRIRFPKLDKLRWRIDVVISSGSLSRVMRPSILMQLILSDGSIQTFVVELAQFHALRYGVAKLLREMQTIERHPIMRVAHELQKREDADRNK